MTGRRSQVGIGSNVVNAGAAQPGRSRAWGWLVVVAGAVLAGCNSTPTRDPDFAAVRPAAVPPPAATPGSLYRPGQGLVLFQDMRARQVGDILSIRLNESTNASKSAETTLDRSTNANVANPTLFGTRPEFGLPAGVPLAENQNLNLETNLSSSSNFDGDGSSSQSNSLT